MQNKTLKDMTTQIHSDNARNDQQSKIESLEATVKELRCARWDLAQKTNLTVTEIVGIYFKKVLKEIEETPQVLILIPLGLLLTLSILAIGLVLAATSIKFMIHLVEMNYQSISQTIINKLTHHGDFNFIENFSHNCYFSFIFLLIILVISFVVTVVDSVMNFKLDDLE